MINSIPSLVVLSADRRLPDTRAWSGMKPAGVSTWNMRRFQAPAVASACDVFRDISFRIFLDGPFSAWVDTDFCNKWLILKRLKRGKSA